MKTLFSLRRDIYQLRLLQGSFRVLINDYEFEYGEALAQFVNFMLPDSP